MSKLLIIFNGNWADEMDVKGFEIVEKGWWDKYVERFPDKPFSHYVGSNQEMEFSSKKDYFDCFSVYEITEEEEKVIKKFFKYGDFGRMVWNEDFDMDGKE